jgi:putative acetyltransferase
MSDEKEVEDAVQCWIGFCRYSCSLTATVNGEPCGIGTLFLMPYRKVAHHCLFKVIVDPKYQKQGVGTSLIKNLKHLAKNYFKLELMHIEVFEGNPLIPILKKLDFHEFARQERFVKEGDQYLTRVLLESNL